MCVEYRPSLLEEVTLSEEAQQEVALLEEAQQEVALLEEAQWKVEEDAQWPGMVQSHIPGISPY